MTSVIEKIVKNYKRSILSYEEARNLLLEELNNENLLTINQMEESIIELIGKPH